LDRILPARFVELINLVQPSERKMGTEGVLASTIEPADQPVRKNSFVPIAVLAVLLLGCGLRIGHYLQNRSLWMDEAMLARNVVERDFFEILKPLSYHQGAPPLFLLLVKSLTWLWGPSELVLRLLPLAASLGSLILFWLLARQIVHPALMLAALFIFSCSRSLVYYSQEFKQYSVDVATALCLFWLLAKALRRPVLNRKMVAGFAAVGILAQFLSHPALFVLAGIWAALGIGFWHRGQRMALMSLGLAWGIAFALNYLIFLRPLAEDRELSAYWSHSYIALPLTISGLKSWYHTGKDFLFYFCGISGWEIFFLSLAAVAAAMALERKMSLWIGIMVTFACAWGAALLHVYPFAERLALYLVPMFILLICRGLQELTQGRSRGVCAPLILLAVLPFCLSLMEFFTKPISTVELRPLLAFLEAHIQSGDRVLIRQGDEHVVKYYLETHFPDHGDQYCFADSTDGNCGKMQANQGGRLWQLLPIEGHEERDAMQAASGRSILNEQVWPGVRLILFGPSDPRRVQECRMNCAPPEGNQYFIR
jgi:hypothetical protein